MAFIAGVGVSGVAGRRAVCQKNGARVAVVRKCKENDLLAAQNCMEEGCEVNEVQEILARLGQKKESLELEAGMIAKVMADLAKANLSDDRSFVQETMEAAINIFKRAEDAYPKVGSPTPWTMDKPAKGKKRWD